MLLGLNLHTKARMTCFLKKDAKMLKEMLLKTDLLCSSSKWSMPSSISLMGQNALLPSLIFS